VTWIQNTLQSCSKQTSKIILSKTGFSRAKIYLQTLQNVNIFKPWNIVHRWTNLSAKIFFIFRSKIFGNNFEEFSESEILIIDCAGVDELNGASIIIIKEVADWFKVEDLYTMKVNLKTVLNAFEDGKSEPDMKDGNNT
jgi:hypothetical protein